MASCTPTSPRATRERRNSVQKRVGLRGAEIQADDLAAAGLMVGVSDDDALALHAAAIADLLDLRVDEQIQVTTLPAAAPGTLGLVRRAGRDPADFAL
jgi:hypothetical protein